MARRRHIDIDTSGIKALEKNLAASKTEVIENMLDAADEVLLNTEHDAQALAPRDSGDLESSIISTQAREQNGHISGKVGSNKVYALRRHEEQPREGSYHKYEDGVRYDNYYFNGRGELTRVKPTLYGQAPGRKYLSRAGNLNQDNWKNNLANAIRQTYGGK